MIVLLLMCAPVCQAEETDLAAANARIAELEAQVRQLEAQLVMLKAELKDTKVEADQARARAAEAAADAEASDAEEVKTYSSLEDVLREMPRELRPDERGGWSKYKQPEVNEWYRTHPVGHNFKRRAKVTAVRVNRTFGADADSNRAWTVRVYFEADKCQFEGMSFGDGIDGITLYGDADFAKSAEAFKEGTSVQVTGKIDRLHALVGLQNGQTVVFFLSDAVIHHPTFDQSEPDVVTED